MTTSDPPPTNPLLKDRTLATTRERAAARRNLQALFQPRSIAVVGASDRDGSVGRAIWDNLQTSGFAGDLYAVNRRPQSIQPCYANLDEIEGSIDLAVIAVPAAIVPDVIEACGAKSVQAAIVLSAGFKEVGSDGAELERRTAARAREVGVALLGPNCLGLINTDPAVRLNASFARTMPEPGGIAFMSQSGALCTSILDYARSQQIGFSKFISFGNKADVSESDLLAYLGDDPQTRVILMYLESLDDGQRFIHLARDITSAEAGGKPILAIKTGRTPQGASAAASHTGSLAGSDEVYDAIMAQSGVLRVDTVQELFDTAMAISSQPMPRGNRVAIVTNAGGPGILATDASVRSGLQLASLSEPTQRTLAAQLPASASVKNPVDVLGDARSARYAAALDAALADAGVDGAIVLLTPQTMTDIEAVAEIVVARSKDSDKPLLASFMGGEDVAPGIAILRRHDVPHYRFPEDAARSLAAMCAYGDWRARPRTVERVFDVDRATAGKLIDAALHDGRRHLHQFESLRILAAYGIPVLLGELATSPDEVGPICARVGLPVALKIASSDMLHKTDVGGVVLGIASIEEATGAYRDMLERARQHDPEARIDGVQIQPMATPGREVIIGATRDATFGPLVMFGLGGIYAEALRDVAFRLAPLRQLSAHRMLQSIRARRILEGMRGEAPVDSAALEECLERLSQLVVEFPVIAELDMNPVFAYADGALAADARIVLT